MRRPPQTQSQKKGLFSCASEAAQNVSIGRVGRAFAVAFTSAPCSFVGVAPFSSFPPSGKWLRVSCAPGYNFGGMGYDSETGNYYDHARCYNPRLGRFMSPDPMNVGGFSNPDNPQSWNGYAYTLNNPETLVDPSGACVTSSVDGSVVGQSQGGMWEGPCSPPTTASDNSFGPGNPLWWA
jgi:RHS repeat-associated protein